MKPRPLKILLCAAAKSDPASRFRIFQFVPYLRQLGFEVDTLTPTPGHFWKFPFTKIRTVYWGAVYAGAWLRLLSRLPVLWRAKKYDLIMMNRPLVPDISKRFLEPWLQRRNPRIIFDFDDAIHLVGNNGPKIQSIVSLSAWVTPGNAYLAEFASRYNKNVTIIPTVVDTKYYKPATQRQPGPVRIGWSGSTQTLGLYLPLIKPVITELAKEEEFEFIVIANQGAQIDWPAVRLRFIPWNPQTESSDLQQIDVGLMPLPDNPFEKGKCGLKLLQYGAHGCPAISSPVGVNREIIINGETGFLASTAEEWESGLRQLIRDQALRERMGRAARERVEDHYSVKIILPQLVKVFKKVMQK